MAVQAGRGKLQHLLTETLGQPEKKTAKTFEGTQLVWSGLKKASLSVTAVQRALKSWQNLAAKWHISYS